MLLQATAAGACLFFVFVGTFSFVLYRLEGAPFDFTATQGSLLFAVWIVGGIGPAAGRLADRWGWQRPALVALCLSATGVLVTLVDSVPAIVVGLAVIATAMFGGITAAQLGVSSSTTVDRGMASAFYFTCYYTLGGVGAHVPGLVWRAGRWPGVVTMMVVVLAPGITVQLAYPSRPGSGKVGWSVG